MCRPRYDQPTSNHLNNRTKEYLSKKGTLRCLKGYIVREAFSDLTNGLLRITVHRYTQAEGPARLSINNEPS